jgi:hypothetical protein
MKQVFQIILSLGIGILIGWVIGCNQKVRTIEKEKIVTKIDTIREEVQVKIPIHVTKYVTREDSIFKFITDSIYLDRYVDKDEPIPVNEYQDSILTKDYKLKYDISTVGQLLDFKYDLSLFKETPIKPRVKNWMVSGSVSDKLNFKLGFGYKGWNVEGVLGKNNRELFAGKQFNF